MKLHSVCQMPYENRFSFSRHRIVRNDNAAAIPNCPSSRHKKKKHEFQKFSFKSLLGTIFMSLITCDSCDVYSTVRSKGSSNFVKSGNACLQFKISASILRDTDQSGATSCKTMYRRIRSHVSYVSVIAMIICSPALQLIVLIVATSSKESERYIKHIYKILVQLTVITN